MRGTRFLGLISYPLYLIHFYLVFRILDAFELLQRRVALPLIETGKGGAHLFADTWGGNVAAMACVTVVIGAASAVHYVIEEPGRRWSRRVAARHWARRAGNEAERRFGPVLIPSDGVN